MNGLPTEPSGLTRGRFWGVVAILFAMQAGLIMVFAERDHKSSRPVRAPAVFRLLESPLTPDELAKRFFAIDPTVFPLPSLHGFSGRAWLSLPGEPVAAPVATEEPAWLALNVDRLGTNFPMAKRDKSALAFGPANQPGPELEPWPASLTPDLVRTQSVFEIQGELAGRQLNAPGSLPARASAQLLGKSVVQIAVDSAGQVIAARLMAPRSGSTEADNDALVQARRLRFRPVPASAPAWGTVTIDWQTVEPTNATPASAP